MLYVVARLFVRSDFTHCIVARLVCGAISRFMSLRDFSAEQSHEVVSLRDFLRSDLTRCVIARFFCGAISRFLSLRDFSRVAVLRVVSLRGFS